MTELRNALNSVIKILKHQVNFDLWMITRVVDDDWIMLAASENSYGVNADDVKIWSDTVCCKMVDKKGPNIVPCLNKVDAYAKTPIAGQLDFNSYIGFPLVTEDGHLLGTMCAIDPEIQDASLENQRELIEHFVLVVQTILRQSIQVNRLNSLLHGHSNTHTHEETLGMPNQTAFFEMANAQKEQLQNVGSPLSIILIDIERFPSSFEAQSDEFEGLLSAKSSLQRLKRDSDIMCKLTGNSFGILLIDVDTKALTLQVVNIIKVLQGRGFKVSVGAHVCKQQESIEEGFKKAKGRRFA